MAAALRDHLVVHRGDAVQHALEVDVDAPVPGLGGRRVIGAERQWHRPGAVDQNIDGAEGFDRERAERVGVGPVGDVGTPIGGLPAGGLDLGDGRLQPGFVDVGRDDPRPRAAVCCAISRPKPLAPPVMTTTLSDK